MCGFSKCRSDTEGKEQLPNQIVGMPTLLVATKTAQIFTAVISLAHRKMTNHDCKYFGRLHYTLKATREPRKCYVTGHNAASRNPSPPELKRATTAAGTIKAIRLHLGVYGGQKGLWGISRCVCLYLELLSKFHTWLLDMGLALSFCNCPLYRFAALSLFIRMTT